MRKVGWEYLHRNRYFAVVLPLHAVIISDIGQYSLENGSIGSGMEE